VHWEKKMASCWQSLRGGYSRIDDDGREDPTDLNHIHNIAIPMAYFAVGFAGTLLATPLNIYMVEYLNVEPAMQNTIYILKSLPWSLKMLFGFISDAFPIAGLHRKPYLALGSIVYSFSFLVYALVGMHNVVFLAVIIFMGTLGLIQMDVMADTMTVERSKYESDADKGQMQASCYSVRFTGSVAGAVLGAVLSNKKTWGWGLSFMQIAFLNGLVPLMMVTPFLLPLKERYTKVKHQRETDSPLPTMVVIPSPNISIVTSERSKMLDKQKDYDAASEIEMGRPPVPVMLVSADRNKPIPSSDKLENILVFEDVETGSSASSDPPEAADPPPTSTVTEVESTEPSKLLQKGGVKSFSHNNISNMNYGATSNLGGSSNTGKSSSSSSNLNTSNSSAGIAGSNSSINASTSTTQNLGLIRKFSLTRKNSMNKESPVFRTTQIKRYKSFWVVEVEEIDSTQTIAMQLQEIWETVQLKAVWRPMAFVYIYNMLQVPNVAWQSYLQLTLHFPSWVLGLSVLLGSIMTLAGIIAYKKWFFRSSWRKIYVGTTMLITFFSCLQLVLIFQLNVKYLHMSNYFFSLGDDVIAAYINGIQFLPVCIMYMRLCPDGAEGASYSMLTTFSNVAFVVSSDIGNYLTEIWNVSNDALREHDISGMWRLSLFTSCVSVLPLGLLFLLPKSPEEQERLVKDQYRSKIGGAIFLSVLFGSVGWSIASAVLELVRQKPGGHL
jgi:hypothetical protein